MDAWPASSTTRGWLRRGPRPTRLQGLAPEWGTTPAAIAVAFALANPRVATVLFGATRPEQVDENRRAVDLLETLGAERLRGV